MKGLGEIFKNSKAIKVGTWFAQGVYVRKGHAPRSLARSTRRGWLIFVPGVGHNKAFAKEIGAVKK